MLICIMIYVDIPWHDMLCYDITWQDRTGQGTARHGTARHSTARHGTARRDTTRHGTARHGMARHGTARHEQRGDNYVHILWPGCMTELLWFPWISHISNSRNGHPRVSVCSVDNPSILSIWSWKAGLSRLVFGESLGIGSGAVVKESAVRLI